MLTAIIIDDEIWVCKLLKKIIQWEKLGIELIGEAKDGHTASKMIFDKKPDIVLTDICMPGIDGISLIRKVKEAQLDTNFIIISGYQNFEYAKSALKYDVEDYILKPIEEDDLNNTLLKLRDNILLDRKRKIQEKDMEDQLHRSIDKLKHQYLYKVLYDEEHALSKLDEINKEYQLSFKQGNFQTVILHFDNKADNNEIINLNEILPQLKFKEFCFEAVELVEKRKIVCILNYSSDNHERIIRRIKDISLNLTNFIKEKQESLTIGIGSVENEFKLLNKSFCNAMKAIKYRVIVGTNKIIDISKHDFKDIRIKDLIPIEQQKIFLCMIEVYSYQEIGIWLESLFNNIKTQKQLDPETIFKTINKIMDLFNSIMDQVYSDTEKKIRLDKDIENAKTIDEIHNLVSVYIDSTLRNNHNIRKSQTKKPVELAKSYVSKHYAEQINLADVAKLVYLNPSYLSELFKKEVGVNFRNYISLYRMEIAKELLKEVKYTVTDVGKKVGYKDPKHFSKLFKKTVGIKPSEFKNLHI